MPAALSPGLDGSAHGSTRKETVTIFDWDDTLLASSFLAAKGFNRLDQALNRSVDVDAQLKELEQAVVGVLARASEFGRVYIITNAETGWVQLSAQTFIPGVLPYLEKVNISSARSTYEPAFPQSPVQWKFCAFHDKVVTGFADCANVERNVVSLGDSRVEREAVITVTRGLTQTRCKSIKFSERPTLEQLRMQLDLVTRCFGEICQHDGDLDLQLSLLPESPSVTPPSSPSSASDPMQCVTPSHVQTVVTSATANGGTEPMDTESTPAHVRQCVHLTGYQPVIPMSPYAVACGAYSTLMMNPNGTAVVIPSVPNAVALAAATSLPPLPSPLPPSSATCTVSEARVTAAAAAAAAAAVAVVGSAALNGVEVVEVNSKSLVTNDLVCVRPRQTTVVS